VEALRRNVGAEDTELILYSDAAKNETAVSDVQKTRDYIRTIDGFRSVRIVEREENWGLARSIISGVTETVHQYGRVIVLEDDLVTGMYFLSYMNEALERYQDSKKVFSITGFSHFPNGNKSLPESYFLKVFSSWSWATWENRWELFDENAAGWEKTKTDPALAEAFDYEGCFYNCQMLKAQMEDHTINSWAIRAYWTQFTHDMMTLFPNRRLVENEGFDGTGVHCNTEEDYLKGQLDTAPIREFPREAVELPETRQQLMQMIAHKKQLYKRARIKYYLRHPAEAIAKIKEKLG
jgi:hypothetical protein